MVILEIIGGVVLLGALLYGISNILARVELKRMTIEDESIKNFNDRYGPDSNDATANEVKKDVE